MSVIFLSPEFFKTLCDYAKKTPRRSSAGRAAKVIQLFCIATLAVIFFSNKPAQNFYAQNMNIFLPEFLGMSFFIFFTTERY